MTKLVDVMKGLATLDSAELGPEPSTKYFEKLIALVNSLDGEGPARVGEMMNGIDRGEILVDLVGKIEKVSLLSDMINGIEEVSRLVTILNKMETGGSATLVDLINKVDQDSQLNVGDHLVKMINGLGDVGAVNVGTIVNDIKNPETVSNLVTLMAALEGAGEFNRLSLLINAFDEKGVSKPSVLALMRAVSKVSSRISVAQTSAFGLFFFNARAIQPLPVPASSMRKPSGRWVWTIQSTNSSVSGRGINTVGSTANFKP